MLAFALVLVLLVVLGVARARVLLGVLLAEPIVILEGLQAGLLGEVDRRAPRQSSSTVCVTFMQCEPHVRALLSAGEPLAARYPPCGTLWRSDSALARC